MAGSKSNYLENALLDGVLGGPAFSLPTTIYIALSTAAYSETATGASMSEVSGNGYARVAVTNNATNWPAAASAQKKNGATFSFPAASGTGWGTVNAFYILDALSGGNVLYGGDLTTARSVAAGDTASFAPNGLTITED
jgi:hypothetical protein